MSPAKLVPPTSMLAFDGRNGRFAGGRVHAVAPCRWIGELHVPGPACHTPAATFDPADFQPTSDAVTCRRCVKWHAPAAAPVREDPKLFDLEPSPLEAP